MGWNNFINHSWHLRSLYREIYRGVSKVRNINPVLTEENPSTSEFRAELERASIDLNLYRKFLFSEIQYNLRERFSIRKVKVKDHVWYRNLTVGHALASTLHEIQTNPASSKSWNELVKHLIAYRGDSLRQYEYKRQYESNRAIIEARKFKDMHPLQVKRIMTSRQQRQQRSQRQRLRQKRETLCLNDASSLYKKRMEESEENANFVLRNYLKKLQLQGKIPNPFRLPYVSINIYKQAAGLPKQSIHLPGSTKANILVSAYDFRYIESILKPEIEYLINKKHFFSKFSDLVNTKGPYKVKIRTTHAGSMAAHYLRLPENNSRQMKSLAMDVRNSMRAVHKQTVWNCRSSEKSKTLEDKRKGEGYAVRGSGGHSVEEIMYPREYYEQLAMAEAQWEYLISLEVLKQARGEEILKSPAIAGQLQAVYQGTCESWLAPLDEATMAVNNEVIEYRQKYKLSKNSAIWGQRRQLQKKMISRHKILIIKFRRLLSLLEKDKVNAHSDLYHIVTKRSSKGIVKLATKKNLAEKSRLKKGKTLGDYLEQVGLKGYKCGYKFARRLNIV